MCRISWGLPRTGFSKNTKNQLFFFLETTKNQLFGDHHEPDFRRPPRISFFEITKNQLLGDHQEPVIQDNEVDIRAVQYTPHTHTQNQRHGKAKEKRRLEKVYHIEQKI